MATYPGNASLQIIDQYGIVGTAPVTITVDDTTTVAQLNTFASDYIGVVGDGNLTQGQVVKAVVSLTFGEGTDTTTPAGDIEKGALFNFSDATTPYRTGMLIPDLQPSILGVNGLIDLTNTAVTDFVTFMTTVHTGITIVTKGLRALNALVDALIAFRKHRKPLSRKTTEKA